MNTKPQPTEVPTPWWRVGMVWLVLGGPATVVVAALATAVIAYRGADPVVKGPSTGASERAASIREAPAEP
jgi:hypothetical protein